MSDAEWQVIEPVLGLLLAVLITAASIQDRDGARPLLWNLRRLPLSPADLG